jgi:hypothetical protein
MELARRIESQMGTMPEQGQRPLTY